MSVPGEVGRGEGGPDQAAQIRAQSDAHGGDHCSGVRPVLAPLLSNQHSQPRLHHPGDERHRRGLLLPGHPHLRQLLCEPAPLRLPLRQLQAELPQGALRPQGQRRWHHRHHSRKVNGTKGERGGKPRPTVHSQESRAERTRAEWPGTVEQYTRKYTGENIFIYTATCF